MKKSIIIGICLLILCTPSFAGVISSDCRYKGVPLYGKVKITNSFPDFKVRITDSFPDLKVKNVSSFANSCGRWQFVESFPDFTVKFVESFPDFSIKYVDSFEGI